MTVQDHQRFTINPPVPEHNPNTKASAEKRRQTINEQIDEFFSNGGEIEKLPAYDELEEVRPVAKPSYGRNYEVVR